MIPEFHNILTHPGGFFEDYDGAWVHLHLDSGAVITGVARYSPVSTTSVGGGVVLVLRQTGGGSDDGRNAYREPEFAGTFHYVDPSRIVMIAYAEADA